MGMGNMVDMMANIGISKPSSSRGNSTQTSPALNDSSKLMLGGLETDRDESK